jgi:large subunit ribosomal protein L22
MRFSAKVLFLPISPFKLRPFIDVVRGKSVEQAIRWLSTLTVKRSIPIKKMIESAAANAKNLNNIDKADLKISDIRIDHGPMYKYFKPGAMGRSNVYRKRFSHASVIVEPFAKKKD